MKLRGSLLPGEQVITATRSHESFLFPAALLGFLAVMFFSFASVVYPSTRFFGVLGYLCAAALCWFVVRRLWRWAATGYVLTTQRLVIQRLFGFGRSVSISLDSIEGIDAHRPLLAPGQSMRLSVHSRGTVHVLRQIPRGGSFSGEVAGAQNRLLGYHGDAGGGRYGAYPGRF